MELTSVQVALLVDKYIRECSVNERRALALQVFERREDIDPMPSLAWVIRQVARQHALSTDYVLKDIKRILKKRA
jgi:hypothetical protein